MVTGYFWLLSLHMDQSASRHLGTISLQSSSQDLPLFTGLSTTVKFLLSDSCYFRHFNSSLIDDIILIPQQNRLRWYAHVLQKEDTGWVKKCTEYEVEGSRPRGRPKRTWKEVVQKDCQARNLNREDAMDRGRWNKLIKTGWWSGWWEGECFFWCRFTRAVLDKGPSNGCCCCCQ